MREKTQLLMDLGLLAERIYVFLITLYWISNVYLSNQNYRKMSVLIDQALWPITHWLVYHIFKFPLTNAKFVLKGTSNW